MVGKIEIPSYEQVLVDLRLVVAHGVGAIRSLDLPAIHQIATLADLEDAPCREPAPVITVLRKAMANLGGGTLQEQAEALLGIGQGTALWSLTKRREAAAALDLIVADTFRKEPERKLVAFLAEKILEVAQETTMRQARLEMEQHRHPADSRLAVQWVERFEAYYRIWTPVYALAANLEAALIVANAANDNTEPSSFDVLGSTMTFDDYVRHALHRYVQYALELRRFVSSHGGHWIASDAETEYAISDTIYRIGWHNSFTYDEESWLRRQLADSRHEEVEHFWNVVLATTQGTMLRDKWRDYISEGIGRTSDSDKQTSQVWLTIDACHTYCDLIDNDWLKIADWYRPGSKPAHAVNGETLFDQLAQRISDQRNNENLDR
ncbi:hypothetical protein [Pseudoclavibacter sp. CFCC 11306]|uniref:hypothetical protein n=1 Tax=Pseudoclavibacter sp. CFCC 11306 TaxID=1564493 RepID=UPI001300CD4E|nr:hypothetical protein [Pseudoclavibacter sp. CFCC 11306]KAB1658165.1 hypothetical protein F8O09_00580 [Pseudoclavibacter sp. CFCC 11306]